MSALELPYFSTLAAWLSFLASVLLVWILVAAWTGRELNVMVPIVFFGVQTLLLARSQWLRDRSDWNHWILPALSGLYFAGLLAGRLTEGRRGPAWLQTLQTDADEPMTFRSKIVLVLAVILYIVLLFLFPPSSARN